MLISLSIKNIALIKDARTEFSEGLNILSGETGAGKSIIVDGLTLLSGARFDKSLLRYGEESGFIEGTFSLGSKGGEVLSEMGEEGDDLAVLNRRFFADGRSEARINGRLVSLSMLKKLASALFDICGQSEHQTLLNPSSHLRILDWFARKETEPIKKEVAKIYGDYKESALKLSELGDDSARAKNADLYKFQLEEIKEGAVKEHEEEELYDLKRRFLSAEKIASALSEASGVLAEGESSAVNAVSEAERALSSLSSLSADYSEWADRLSSALIEIEDIAESVKDELSSLDFSPAELDKAENRLMKIRSLSRKYGDFNKMTAYARELEKKLFDLEDADALYEKLLKQTEQIKQKLYGESVKLSDIRKKYAVLLEDYVKKEISALGMNGADFKTVFMPLPDKENAVYSAGGIDQAEFYLCPNPGQPLKPLVKIASGGELSRLMLALKTVSGETDDVPTLVFDEIDTGISGAVGREVAKKMAELSVTRQLLCVTHLPQIAAMADRHFYISKSVKEGETYTQIQMLNNELAVDEVARLSGGQGISDRAGENAKQMKDWCDGYKKSLKTDKKSLKLN